MKMKKARATRLPLTMLLIALTIGATVADEVKRTRLQGAARLGRNGPVIGATVTAIPEDGTPQVYLTSTDRRGAFRIGAMPEGDYHVEIRREGLTPVVKDNVTLKFPFRAVVEVQMTPDANAATGTASVATSTAPVVGTSDNPGSLTATVVDLDGNPVTEVDVRLAPVGGGTDPRLLRTDEYGEIEANDLPAGRWAIAAHALGYLPLRTEFEMAGPVEMKLVVVPQPGDYQPSPLDLLPPEEPIPPPALQEQLTSG